METPTWSEILEFLDKFNKPHPGWLGEVQEQSYKEGLPIVMRDVANFLQLLLTLKQPANILEIGCAEGFSAMMFSEFARVTTVERFPVMAERAKANFEKYGLTDKITLIHECGSAVLPRLAAEGVKFDFVFMDCGKGQYSRFFPYVLELLEVGGVVCVDDVLQNGTLAQNTEAIPRRLRTIHRNLNEFLQTVTNHPQLKSSILPIGDGLLVCTKHT